MYLIIKNAHISFALISIGLFVIRAFWSVRESPYLEQRWVKVIPHLNDTLLLACAIYLAVVSRQYPLTHDWLTAKLFALCLYIGLGTVAIKRGKTALIRSVFAVLAVTVFAYIVAVAQSRTVFIF